MKKGFTLLELLIVIGIIAVLASVVALVLNPAELLRQSRDAQRISDLDTLRTAINFHLSTANMPDTNYGGTGTSTRITVSGANCPFSVACTANSSTVINGSGWVNVDFTDVGSGNAPISILPMDPVNNATYYYAYGANDANMVFELNARLESNKYRAKMVSDGGDKNTCSTYTENTCYYEVGTALNL